MIVVEQDYFSRLSEHGDVGTFENFVSRRPSRRDRFAAGRQLRSRVPRKEHGLYVPAKNRPDPLAIIEEQNRTRVQKLIPIRMTRMSASTFGFYRGTAAVMSADLASTPVTGMNVAACGDMHVANLGVFGSAERSLIFSINDFDEVHPGPWEWDIKRLAASAVLATRFMGGDDVSGEEAARAVVTGYRTWIRRYANMGFLDVWYSQIAEDAIYDAMPRRLRPGIERIMKKARAKGRLRTLDKLTEVVEGEHRIVEDAPLIVREQTLDNGTPVKEALEGMLRAYVDSLTYDRRRILTRYRLVDVARKVVGVGSVGTACWVLMLEGMNDDDPLFLQVKQALPSVLTPYVDLQLPFINQGRRVVVGQRMIQGSPDIFLGWGVLGETQFYVRQLADMKGGIEFVENDKKGIDGLKNYCHLCGWALALAHAKSGDPAMISGYCGRGEVLDDAIGKFSISYANQAARDYERLLKILRLDQSQGGKPRKGLS